MLRSRGSIEMPLYKARKLDLENTLTLRLRLRLEG